MPHIQFKDVSKDFSGNNVLKPFSAEIENGEFLVLLGPSGCGKSTLLRMIAGLTEISAGELLFDGEVVNDRDVRERNVAFVFQSYALYPQMTVRQNIAFPLVMKRMKAWQHFPLLGSFIRSRIMKEQDVKEQVNSIAEQLGLTPLLDRRPGALSGGQRQRVALGRSLVRDPSLYLLDEPLSNLDAKLRTQMRIDISKLHRDVGKTFIYVTHDQVEAMTMATRIIVMNNGDIQQIGTPDEIYDHPQNTFVAKFVGSPAMNLFSADVVREYLHRTSKSVDLGHALVGVRPEHIQLNTSSGEGIPANVELIERLGAELIVGLQLEGSQGDESRIFVRVPHNHGAKLHDNYKLTFDSAQVSLFHAGTGQRISSTTNIAQ